ncbi:transcriptional repressor NrdR [Candidatus Gracilibacteria bacterium]|nr:transcriptional repressor NrdR [Candidatus Gracilibacteria bacterium]
MYCPKCKSENTRVLDTRVAENGKLVKRKRECENCFHKFTTFERIEFPKFFVLKNNGKKEFYNRDKLEDSILKACNKRYIDLDRIEQMIIDLENSWASNKRAISSKRIGKDILEGLKKLDEVAYIRYASVYHNFINKNDFLEFISGTKDNKENVE